MLGLLEGSRERTHMHYCAVCCLSHTLTCICSPTCCHVQPRARNNTFATRCHTRQLRCFCATSLNCRACSSFSKIGSIFIINYRFMSSHPPTLAHTSQPCSLNLENHFSDCYLLGRIHYSCKIKIQKKYNLVDVCLTLKNTNIFKNKKNKLINCECNKLSYTSILVLVIFIFFYFV